MRRSSPKVGRLFSRGVVNLPNVLIDRAVTLSLKLSGAPLLFLFVICRGNLEGLLADMGDCNFFGFLSLSSNVMLFSHSMLLCDPFGSVPLLHCKGLRVSR